MVRDTVGDPGREMAMEVGAASPVLKEDTIDQSRDHLDLQGIELDQETTICLVMRGDHLLKDLRRTSTLTIIWVVTQARAERA